MLFINYTFTWYSKKNLWGLLELIHCILTACLAVLLERFCILFAVCVSKATDLTPRLASFCLLLLPSLCLCTLCTNEWLFNDLKGMFNWVENGPVYGILFFWPRKTKTYTAAELSPISSTPFLLALKCLQLYWALKLNPRTSNHFQDLMSILHFCIMFHHFFTHY